MGYINIKENDVHMNPLSGNPESAPAPTNYVLVQLSPMEPVHCLVTRHFIHLLFLHQKL